MSEPHPLQRVQDRLAILFGSSPEARPTLIAAMLHRGPAEVAGYWTQLLIAAGIATGGLVLGSTAVIIGAMLVAPLMGPILGLGMGLGAGSLVLTSRATTRVIASMGAVVAASAAMTLLLPFHSVNSEIAARTTPTALDLAVAVFCAMAGVFATVRPASDVATTAAGTSIGISLVPPLCVSGYGLGTGDLEMAQGAGLLFLTNFGAIVAVASVAFAALGFGQVDVDDLEARALEGQSTWLMGPIARRVNRALRAVGGRSARLVTPLILVAALYSPLRRGLDEVVWQIQARGAVDAAISRLPNRVVQTRVQVERGRVQVMMFLLGGPEEAAAAKDALVREISAASGTVPMVEVFAVPDAAEFDALERSVQVPRLPPPEPPPPEPIPRPPVEIVDDGRVVIAEAIAARWPDALGEPLSTKLDVLPSDELVLRVTYVGSPAEPALLETLTAILSEDLRSPIKLTLLALPGKPVSTSPLDDAVIAHFARHVAEADDLPNVHLCVRDKGSKQIVPLPAQSRAATFGAIVASFPRVTREVGPDAAWFAVGGCAPAAAPAP